MVRKSFLFKAIFREKIFAGDPGKTYFLVIVICGLFFFVLSIVLIIVLICRTRSKPVNNWANSPSENTKGGFKTSDDLYNSTDR